MIDNKLTIIITSFKSKETILSCLKSIDTAYKIIVVENSNDNNFKLYIEGKFSNSECVIAGENLGYAKGNNLGLSKVKTQYALIINPDVVLREDTIRNFFISADKIKKFAIIAPTSEDGNSLKNQTNSITEVDQVKGFAMFLNMNEFKEVGFFDSNFFIYLEEIDLCKRLKKNNKKIYTDSNILVKHLGGASHDEEYNFEMELSRNWHWMWSTFYFSKKYNGYLRALYFNFTKLISCLIKSFYFSITMNKSKKLIYLYRFLGLFNSIIGKKSWYRPFNKS